ncbi:MAG: hypothetical protein Q7R95_05020 [bacterium]|nr:hypothetical protein [bacterium]
MTGYEVAGEVRKEYVFQRSLFMKTLIINGFIFKGIISKAVEELQDLKSEVISLRKELDLDRLMKYIKIIIFSIKSLLKHQY